MEALLNTVQVNKTYQIQGVLSKIASEIVSSSKFLYLYNNNNNKKKTTKGQSLKRALKNCYSGSTNFDVFINLALKLINFIWFQSTFKTSWCCTTKAMPGLPHFQIPQTPSLKIQSKFDGGSNSKLGYYYQHPKK